MLLLGDREVRECQEVTFTKDILSAGGQSQSVYGFWQLVQPDKQFRAVEGDVPEILNPDWAVLLQPWGTRTSETDVWVDVSSMQTLSLL